jgi:DedD protein
MPLPSFLQRKDPQKPAGRRPAPAAAVQGDDGPVQAARTRARRRLIGAVVLLAAGIVGFPLLFETQPRPVAVDIAIDMPRKDSGSVATVPLPKPDAAPRVPAAAPTEATKEVLEPIPAAAKPMPPAPPAPAAAKPVPTAPASAAAAATTPATTPPAAKPATADDGQRAKALLDDRAASVAAAARDGRFVVQVGAFTDPVALRDVRQRVEKLGLKTYTQVVDTDAGKRTRVRVGPFATRDEADAAGTRLKAAGLPAAILTL